MIIGRAVLPGGDRPRAARASPSEIAHTATEVTAAAEVAHPAAEIRPPPKPPPKPPPVSSATKTAAARQRVGCKTKSAE